MSLNVPLSCLSSLGLSFLTACAVPAGPVRDICGRPAVIIQSENVDSVRHSSQAINDAVKSGSFKSGSGITSSITAPGITVTRRPAGPAAPFPDCE